MATILLACDGKGGNNWKICQTPAPKNFKFGVSGLALDKKML
jgi:hypothetical protein